MQVLILNTPNFSMITVSTPDYLGRFLRISLGFINTASVTVFSPANTSLHHQQRPQLHPS